VRTWEANGKKVRSMHQTERRLADFKIGGLDDKSGKRALVVNGKVLSPHAIGKKAVPSLCLARAFGNSNALFLEAACWPCSQLTKVQANVSLSLISHMTLQDPAALTPAAAVESNTRERSSLSINIMP
jgi:hypothetical protein